MRSAGTSTRKSSLTKDEQVKKLKRNPFRIRLSSNVGPSETIRAQLSSNLLTQTQNGPAR